MYVRIWVEITDEEYETCFKMKYSEDIENIVTMLRLIGFDIEHYRARKEEYEA